MAIDIKETENGKIENKDEMPSQAHASNSKSKSKNKAQSKSEGRKSNERTGPDETLTLNLGLNQLKVDEVVDQILAKAGQPSQKVIEERQRARQEKKKKRGPRMAGGHTEL